MQLSRWADDCSVWTYEAPPAANASVDAKSLGQLVGPGTTVPTGFTYGGGIVMPSTTFESLLAAD